MLHVTSTSLATPLKDEDMLTCMVESHKSQDRVKLLQRVTKPCSRAASELIIFSSNRIRISIFDNNSAIFL